MENTRKTICSICTKRCIVNAGLENGRLISIGPVKDEGFEGCSQLCVKGLCGPDYEYRPDRVLTPLLRVGEKGEGKFKTIGWDEAYGIIAQKLLSLRREHGADSVAFFSGYSKWYRPMLRRLAISFGSVNYGTESSTCHRSTVIASMCDTGFQSRPDYARAGVMLTFARGRFPAPAKKARERGMKIIAVDCRSSRDIELYADLHLRPRPGTDIALVAGIARLLIEKGGADIDYIDKYVHGFEVYREYVSSFTPQRVEQLTGVPAELVEKAADMIRDNLPMCMFNGFTGSIHHRNGMQIFRAWEALSAITGCYGRPGGNLPMGPLQKNGHIPCAYDTLSFSRPRELEGDLIGGRRFPLWAHMLDECQALDFADAADKGRLKAIFALGFNARMMPGSETTFRLLEKLDFFVDCDLWLSDAAKYADIVLPVCTSYEREQLATVAGDNRLWYSAPIIEPQGLSRSDEDILIGLAEALELDDELLRAGKYACWESQLGGCGISLEELRQRKTPYTIPVHPEPRPLEDGFLTPSGKFELYSLLIEQLTDLDPLPRHIDPLWDQDRETYPFTLMAGVRTDRYAHVIHSRTHTVPALRSRRPEAAVDMHPDDAAALGLEKGCRVRLETSFGSIEVALDFDDKLLPGTVNMYQGYSEADVNTLIPSDYLDPYTGFPGFKAIACRVVKA